MNIQIFCHVACFLRGWAKDLSVPLYYGESLACCVLNDCLSPCLRRAVIFWAIFEENFVSHETGTTVTERKKSEVQNEN